jgi:ectoine hydroxylase-related dioxygenase (phytanoyl-CoA dioxygenase family)
LVIPLIEACLGEKFILGAMSSVVSFPGAPDQRLHRDSKAIFADDFSIDKDIPPYAITMLVPLVDCNLQTGCTKVWPGSHLCKDNEEAMKTDCIDPEVRVGSVLVTNSKLLHRGGANRSNQIRPLIYLTYHRSWFRDFWGYESRPPVEISKRELEKVPPQYQHLFAWTKDPYKSIRIRSRVERLVPVSAMRLIRRIRGTQR